MPTLASLAATQNRFNTYAFNGVWDVSLLEFVAMQQPTIQGETINVAISGPLAVTVADGASTTLGALADAAVGDASGSVNAHLRQIAKTLASGTVPVSIASMPSTPVTGPLTDVQLRTTPVPVSGTVAITAAALPLPEGASTEVTLALIKAKTDNLNVTLSGGGTHVIVDSAPAAPSAADVLAVDGDAGYVAGETGKKLTQTPDGRLRATVAGLVSEAAESYINGEIRSLSLNTEGRLRVSAVPADTELEMFLPFSSTGEWVENRAWSEISPWG